MGDNIYGKKNSGQTSLGLTSNFVNHIQKDNIVFTIRDNVDKLDLSVIEDQYTSKGRTSYPMKDMICVILLEISELDFSYRNLENCCRYDIRYMWLLDSRVLDHSTIHRFHQRFMNMEDEFMKAQIKLLVEQGTIDLEKISIDGTKIKSLANKYTNVYLGTVVYREKIWKM